MILEMFTGKRPTDEMFNDNQNLHNYFKDAWPDQVAQVVDVRMKLVEEDMSKVEKFLEGILRLGLKCSVEASKERMDITDVQKELVHIKARFLFSQDD